MRLYKDSLEVLLKPRFLGPTHQGSDVGGLWWGLRILTWGCAQAVPVGGTLAALPWALPYAHGPGPLTPTALPSCLEAWKHCHYLGLRCARLQLVFSYLRKRGQMAEPGQREVSRTVRTAVLSLKLQCLPVSPLAKPVFLWLGCGDDTSGQWQAHRQCGAWWPLTLWAGSGQAS